MLKLSPELIEKLDGLADSPSKTASKVYSALKESHPDLTQYDLYCFAIEMLASGVHTGELKYAEGSIRITAKDFYYAHYLRVSEACLSGINQELGETPTDTTSVGASPIIRKHLRLQ
jgi:hypothetical protein